MSRFGLLGSLAPSTLAGGLLLLALSCGRKTSAPEHDWASNHGATQPAPVVTETPLPLEPPFGPVRVPNSGFPCDVDDVLAAKCRRCHSTPTRHNAPFSLLTWEDTQPLFRDRPRFQVMASAVKSGFMPYSVRTNPPVERLSDAEKQVIVDWAEAGALRASCGPAAAASSSARPLAKKNHKPKL